MSGMVLLEIVMTILQSIVLLFIIAKTIRLIVDGKNVFLPFFFMLAMVSCLLSNLYWIAYDFLKPDTRMPIACNEIGDCAMILLLSAGLESLLNDKKKVAGEIAFAFLFISANIASWIVWSGEWVQDILFGMPYVYFLWILIRGIRSRGVLVRKELWFAALTSSSVLVLQIPLLFMNGCLLQFISVVCFVVMFALIVWFGVKSFRRKDFFVTSAFFLWTELAMFLSPEPYYSLVFGANIIVLPMMFLTMKRELADGLC